jgi:outer membrane protein OmpA-like peptidoglycan-associated protein
MTTDIGNGGAQSEHELKQLLFSRELAQLSDLQRRADQLDARVGNEPALTESVETVLVEVLRTAEARDHERVASALAPLIASSMRTEIRNSRDMMVDALYPITGRLVAAAVKDAIKQAFEQVDQKLDSALSFDRWRARLISRITGRSQAEILLRYRPRFRVEAFLLADRATGAPIARHGGFGRTDEGGESDDELFAGMLNATLTFARNALRETEGGDLRRLDFGGAELFLRTSPTLLLAVRTSGPPPINIDERLERLFVNFLSANRHAIDVGGPLDPADGAALSEDLLARLNAVASDAASQKRGLPWKGLIAAAAVLAVGVWFGGNAWLERSERTAVRSQAEAAIAGIPALNGYRIEAFVDDTGLRITGLAPTKSVLERLQVALSSIAADAQMPLTLAVNTLPAPAEQNASAVADALLPEVERRLAPLSRTVADVAFRTQDLEDAVEDNASRSAAQANALAALQTALADTRAGLAETAASAEAARRQISAEIASERASANGDIAAIERTQDRATERLAETRAALDVVSSRLATASTSLTDLTDQVRSDAAVAIASTRAVNQRIEENENAVADTIATTTAELSSKIEAAQTIAEERLQDTTRAFSDDLRDANADLTAKIETASGVASQRIRDTQSTLAAKIDQETAELSGRFDTVSATIEKGNHETERTLAAVGATINEISRQMRVESERVAVAEQRLAVLSGLPSDTANNAAGLQTIAAALESVNSQISVESDRIAAAEKALAALAGAPAAAAANDTKISALAADIEALRNRIANLAGADAAAVERQAAAAVSQSAQASAAALAETDRLAVKLSEIEQALAAIRAAPPATNQSSGAETSPELTAQLEDLEERASDAITILDQRIDRIARAAEPKAESPVQAANRALQPLVITFISSDQPNDNDAALDTLRKAADVALSMPASVKLRIVGYADSDGAVEANRITSQRRSDWAYNALMKLGVQPDRMVSVGRGAERLLSASADENSPNRRVEFESFYAINPSERD